ncbi:MAG: glucose-6-phosphate dehydrogenase [Candidatus Parcubacteria bacterium]|jgi:glucose-6-phosphate 1-dehydrogenase
MTKDIIFILFGATGDLASKKIIPALETLWSEGGFSLQSRVIGVSRRDWKDADFADFFKDATKGKTSPGFRDVLLYSKIDIESGTGYEVLSEKVLELKRTMPQAEVIIYLSLAPQYHAPVIENLFLTGISVRKGAKLLIEKPFGTDEATARSLNALITKKLDENDIYRVDHYLSKQASQDIMNGAEKTKKIKSIRARMFEKHGIEGRGASYDGVGAFRDVGQNHMLEMIALSLARETDGNWHEARAHILRRLVPPENTCADFRRGQYEGYVNEKGVAPGSETETAFRVVTMLDRILITLESGKKMNSSEASVVITYKDGTEQIFDYRAGREAYVTMIESAIKGDKRQFVGFEEVTALWNYADHVQTCWCKVPLEIYSENKPFLVQ